MQTLDGGRNWAMESSGEAELKRPMIAIKLAGITVA